uniref:Methyltransferase type 11 domain-containing protein n=1 Tax=Mantoniella antarctica TaxID=81844 RepID=A0A7S0SBL0_9CHLO
MYPAVTRPAYQDAQHDKTPSMFLTAALSGGVSARALGVVSPQRLRRHVRRAATFPASEAGCSQKGTTPSKVSERRPPPSRAPRSSSRPVRYVSSTAAAIGAAAVQLLQLAAWPEPAWAAVLEGSGVGSESILASSSSALHLSRFVEGAAGVVTGPASEHAELGRAVLFQLGDIGDVTGGWLGPLLSVLGGFAIAKTVVYWRVQYITAAMIAKHVPPGAARVLEFGVGQGRNLYYYPKGTGMVVGVDPDAKEDLLIQVSIAAGVPLVSKAQSLEAPTGQGDGTLDAVVTTGALRRSNDPEAIVREAGRCLKPGAPLVFVEDLSWGFGDKGAGVMEALQGSAAAAEFFEPPQYDELWATLPLSPVAIGIAVRKGLDTGTETRGSPKKVKDAFETSTGLSGKRGKRTK